MEEKSEIYEQRPAGSPGGSETGDDIKTGTSDDAHDMHRLGKKQEFKRNFSSFSILGVTCVVMATWEALIG